MKSLPLTVLVSLGLATNFLFSQTPTNPNESFTISNEASTEAFSISWWGRSEKIYYLQTSENLIDWAYLPFLEEGADETLTWGLGTNAERQFFRLIIRDHPGGDPKLFDGDGDSYSDWEELLAGTDLRDYYNGILPTLEIIAGGGQWGNVGEVLPIPLSVQVSFGLQNAPVQFTVQGGGALLSANGTSDWSSTLNIRSAIEWPTAAIVYVKLPQQVGAISSLQASVTVAGQTVQIATWAGVYDQQLVPPTNLVAKPMAADRIDLTWTLTHPELPTTVESSLDHGATWEMLEVVPAGVSAHSVTGLEEHRLVKFRLRSGGTLP
ncbi:hypothetical protein FEM03_17855 [Phragmitibacter flavus]|uniref:Uncharacterized protein n=1 Tax=Phragmitibacter flavus TaxID=2576071 RepID=A0A5R8KB26_9BACT|nr:fibronectin type III domain-containing protein [Phragmitibacter flavus]TLD69501.1 hypothetical protein FEM03_17855 [Phragmitibacter flavus]